MTKDPNTRRGYVIGRGERKSKIIFRLNQSSDSNKASRVKRKFDLPKPRLVGPCKK